MISCNALLEIRECDMPKAAPTYLCGLAEQTAFQTNLVHVMAACEFELLAIEHPSFVD